jgi:hypothetical protein
LYIGRASELFFGIYPVIYSSIIEGEKSIPKKMTMCKGEKERRRF